MLINYLANLYSHQKKNLNLTVVGQKSKALNDDEIIELVDKSFGMIRTGSNA